MKKKKLIKNGLILLSSLIFTSISANATSLIINKDVKEQFRLNNIINKVNENFGTTELTLKKLNNIKVERNGWFFVNEMQNLLQSFIYNINDLLNERWNELLQKTLLKNTNNILLNSELNKNPSWFQYEFLPDFSQWYNLHTFFYGTLWNYNYTAWWNDDSDALWAGTKDKDASVFKWNKAKSPLIITQTKNCEFGSYGKIVGSNNKYDCYVENFYIAKDYAPVIGKSNNDYDGIWRTFCSTFGFEDLANWCGANAFLTNSFYFDINAYNVNIINNKLNSELVVNNFKTWIPYETHYRTGIKSGDWTYNKINDEIKDVKLAFLNQKSIITLPYNLDTIKVKIKKIIDKTIAINAWVDDYSTVANELLNQIKVRWYIKQKIIIIN